MTAERRCCSANCQSCLSQTVCSNCNEGYILLNGTCSATKSASPLQLVQKSYSAFDFTFTLNFDEQIKDIDALEEAKLSIIVKDEETGTSEVCKPNIDSPQCKIQSNKSQDGFRIKIKMNGRINKGKMSISALSDNPISSTSQNIPAYPIEIPFAIPDDELAKGLLSSGPRIRTILSASNTGVNLLMAGMGGLISTSLDKIYADLSYLSLLNGPLLYYPKLVLSFLRQQPILSIDIPNIFDGLLSELGCETSLLYPATPSITRSTSTDTPCRAASGSID